MASQSLVDVAIIFSTFPGLVLPTLVLHTACLPVYPYADSLVIPFLAAYEMALSGYPPSHPFEYVVSQSTNYYGERLSDAPYLTLKNPSIAAAAEKAQHDPQLPQFFIGVVPLQSAESPKMGTSSSAVMFGITKSAAGLKVRYVATNSSSVKSVN